MEEESPLSGLVESLSAPTQLAPPAENSGALSDLVSTLTEAPPQKRLEDFLQSRVRAKTPWKEVEPEFTKSFPEQDKKQIGNRYEITRLMKEAKDSFDANAGEAQPTFVEKMMPFGGTLLDVQEKANYKGASDRIQAALSGGQQPRTSDFYDVARYEKKQQLRAARGTHGQIEEGLATIPAMLGEYASGGALLRGTGLFPAAASRGLAAKAAISGAQLVGQTALTPSTYLPQAAERAIQGGGSWYDLKNIAPAVALATLQNGVFAAMGKVGNAVGGEGVSGFLKRFAASAGTGFAGQQIADVLGSAAHLESGYGLIGDLVQGKQGDALQKAAVQAATISAFSLFHAATTGGEQQKEVGRPAGLAGPEAVAGMPEPQGPKGGPGEPSPQMNTFNDALNFLRSRGHSKQSAAEVLMDPISQLKAAWEKNPNLDATAARKLFEAMPEGPIKAYAMSLADAINPPPAEATAAGPGGPGGPGEAPEPSPKPPGEVIDAEFEVAKPPAAQEVPQAEPQAPSEPVQAPAGIPARRAADPRSTTEWQSAFNDAVRKGKSPLAAANEADVEAGGERPFGTREHLDRLETDYRQADAALIEAQAAERRSQSFGVSDADKATAVQARRDAARRVTSLRKELKDARDAFYRNTAPKPTTPPEATGSPETSAAALPPQSSTGGPIDVQALKAWAESPEVQQPAPKAEDFNQPAVPKRPPSAPEVSPEAPTLPGKPQAALPEVPKNAEPPLSKGEPVVSQRLWRHVRAALNDPEVATLAEVRDKVNGFRKKIMLAPLRSDQIEGTLEQMRLANHVEREVDAKTGLSFYGLKEDLDINPKTGKRWTVPELQEAIKKGESEHEETNSTDFERAIGSGLDEASVHSRQQQELQAADEAGRAKAAAQGVGRPAEGGAGSPLAPAEPEAAGDKLKKAKRDDWADLGLTKEQWDGLNGQQRATMVKTKNPFLRAEQVMAAKGERSLYKEAVSEGGIRIATVGNGKPLKDNLEMQHMIENGLPRSLFVKKGGIGLDELADMWQRKGFIDAQLGPAQAMDEAIRAMTEHSVMELGKNAEAEYAASYEEYERSKQNALQQINSAELHPEDRADLHAEIQAGEAEARGGEAASPRAKEPVREDQGQESVGQVEQPPGGGSGQDVEQFAFGANAPGEQPGAGQQPGGGVPRRGSVTLHSFGLPAIMDMLRDIAPSAKPAMQRVMDAIGEFGGKAFPRTTRLNRLAGEALSRYAASPIYIALRSKQLTRLVLGDKFSREQDRLYGATMTEWHLRYTKQAYLNMSAQASARAANYRQVGDWDKARLAAAEAKDALRAAGKVASVIGKAGSPLKNFADYRTSLKSPEFQALLGRWKEHVVPEMEANFRKAKGMADTDPIISETQIPEYPMNLKPIFDGGSVTQSTIPTAPGNLNNLRTGKFRFAEQRKGDAPAYETSLQAIIENSVQHGYSRAAKNDLLRTLVQTGVGEAAPSAAQLPGFKKMDFVKPPPDMASRQEDYYVKDEAYPEVRKAYDVDQPTKLPFGITSALNAVAKGALLSTVEAAYHSTSLLGALSKSHTLVPFFKNTWKVLRGHPEVEQGMVDLAKIGAAKRSGEYETPTPWMGSPWNPFTWTKSFLDGIDRIVRLTLRDSARTMQRKGLAVDTETNMRNYVNQAGLYNRRAQNGLIRALRDTGIGPFSTAVSNWMVQGIKAVLTFGMNPGIEATSYTAAAQIRARMLLKLGALAGAVTAANFIRWGRPDGADDVPVGGLKVGETKDGHSVYFDPSRFLPISRGARITGAKDFIEGKRHGLSDEEIRDRVVNNLWHSLFEAAQGPGPNFIYTARTGKNALGNLVAPQVSKAHTSGGMLKAAQKGKPEAGSSQDWENLKAAIMNFNPTAATLTGADEPHRELTPLEKANKMLGPYGLHEGHDQKAKRR